MKKPVNKENAKGEIHNTQRSDPIVFCFPLKVMENFLSWKSFPLKMMDNFYRHKSFLSKAMENFLSQESFPLKMMDNFYS